MYKGDIYFLINLKNNVLQYNMIILENINIIQNFYKLIIIFLKYSMIIVFIIFVVNTKIF